MRCASRAPEGNTDPARAVAENGEDIGLGLLILRWRARAGELVAALQSTLPARGRSARGRIGRGGSGVNVAANIPENHTIFFIMHTINSQTICYKGVDNSACPIHTTG